MSVIIPPSNIGTVANISPGKVPCEQQLDKGEPILRGTVVRFKVRPLAPPPEREAG